MDSRKRTTRSSDWLIKFDDVLGLRTIVEAVQNVVTRITVNIVKDQSDNTYLLKVETADVAYVSCIIVCYRLDQVETNVDEMSFCVDCKHISPVLSNVRQDHTVVLEYHSGGANPVLVLRTHDADNLASECAFEFPTYVDADNVQLFPMDFDMILEIDLIEFRKVLKHASSAKAEQICLSIRVVEFDAKTYSVTTFFAKGEWTTSQTFCHEVARDVDGSLVVRAASDGPLKLIDSDDIPLKYEGIFPIDKVAGFVKSLQTRMLTAKVMQDMPIMFEHNIGGATDDKSKINFLIAPVNVDP